MKRIAVIIALAVLALPAGAQTRCTILPPVPAWEANIEEQLKQSLRSPSEAIQTQTMRLLIVLTRDCETLRFAGTVGPLLEIYQYAQAPRVRMMAVATLHAINSTYAYQRLAEEVGREESKQVRRVTLAALAEWQKNR